MAIREIENEKRFQDTIDIIKTISYRNIVEIGGTDASFKNLVPHDSWVILDKYGNPDIRVDLDGRTAKLPYEDNTVEFIILTEVLEHLRMGTPLIREISRCLIPGGVLLISVPNAVSIFNRLKWIKGDIPFMAASSDCGNSLGGTGLLIDGEWEGGHVVDFSKSRLKKYVERNGLQLKQFHKTSLAFKGKSILPASMIPVSFGNFLIATFTKP